MTATEIRAEALHRATTNQSWANYPAIFEYFVALGIPEMDIVPRENVFTYNAWLALGRQVRKGEHGCKVVTWIDITKTDKETGETAVARRARTTTVFHVSQTDAHVPRAD